jgi:hypothetical protein
MNRLTILVDPAMEVALAKFREELGYGVDTPEAARLALRDFFTSRSRPSPDTEVIGHTRPGAGKAPLA